MSHYVCCGRFYEFLASVIHLYWSSVESYSYRPLYPFTVYTSGRTSTTLFDSFLVPSFVHFRSLARLYGPPLWYLFVDDDLSVLVRRPGIARLRFLPSLSTEGSEARAVGT